MASMSGASFWAQSCGLVDGDRGTSSVRSLGGVLDSHPQSAPWDRRLGMGGLSPTQEEALESTVLSAWRPQERLGTGQRA